jgi:hypothetical protein
MIDSDMFSEIVFSDISFTANIALEIFGHMHTDDVDFEDLFAWKFPWALFALVSILILMALSEMVLQCPLSQKLPIAE